jgi:hypothetical protein
MSAAEMDVAGALWLIKSLTGMKSPDGKPRGLNAQGR